MMFPPLAAIVGAEGSGKDEAADFYVRTFGAAKYSSGDPIKESFAILYCDGMTRPEIEAALWTHAGKASEHPYLKAYFETEADTRQLIVFEHDAREIGRPGSWNIESLVKRGLADLRPVLFREGLEVHGDKILSLDPLAVMRPMGALARRLSVPDDEAETKASRVAGTDVGHIYRPRRAGTVVFDVAAREDRQTEYIKAGVEGLGEGVVIYVKNPSAEAARKTTHHTASFYERTPHDFVIENDPRVNTLHEYHARLVTLWDLLSQGARSGAVLSGRISSDLSQAANLRAGQRGGVFRDRGPSF